MGQSQQKCQLMLSDGPHLLMEIRVIRILFYFFKEISHVMPQSIMLCFLSAPEIYALA